MWSDSDAFVGRASLFCIMMYLSILIYVRILKSQVYKESKQLFMVLCDIFGWSCNSVQTKQKCKLCEGYALMLYELHTFCYRHWFLVYIFSIQYCDTVSVLHSQKSLESSSVQLTPTRLSTKIRLEFHIYTLWHNHSFTHANIFLALSVSTKSNQRP